MSAPSGNCRPLRDYAIIGDGHGAALVHRDGDIDWCALGRLDAAPVLCGLLDPHRGGRLSLHPHSEFSAARGYLDMTNLLETRYRTETGEATVTDFMPVGRAPEVAHHDYVTLNAPGWLVRIVEGRRGRVTFDVRFRSAGDDYGARAPKLERRDPGVVATDAVSFNCTAPLQLEGTATATARFEVGAGERVVLVLAKGSPPDPCERALELREVTEAYWREWSSQCTYRGPYREAVQRSILVLKLLIYAPSGAVSAAATTSLPETIGGGRNWDYRFCWLRDAAFTLYALAALGYRGEAHHFNAFLHRCLAHTRPQVHILYGLDAETGTTERELPHLAGYCNSVPVRVGNAAGDQHQLDIFGEVLDFALLYVRLGGRLSKAQRETLTELADQVCEVWREPDQGIWEMRGPPRHHGYSKIMAWVAVDRAVRLFGERTNWCETRRRIQQAITERGIDAQGGHLRGAFDEEWTDAALLLAPMVGFPIDEETLARTLDHADNHLGAGPYLRRYDTADALDGQEGAFLVCSFWAVDAQLFLDRPQAARRRFERLLGAANDLGLYTEEIAPQSGDLLGNFPQALTHLAVVRSALALELHSAGGPAHLAGSHADRAGRRREMVEGFPEFWDRLQRVDADSRRRSSAASILRL